MMSANQDTSSSDSSLPPQREWQPDSGCGARSEFVRCCDAVWCGCALRRVQVWVRRYARPDDETCLAAVTTHPASGQRAGKRHRRGLSLPCCLSRSNMARRVFSSCWGPVTLSLQQLRMQPPQPSRVLRLGCRKPLPRQLRVARSPGMQCERLSASVQPRGVVKGPLSHQPPARSDCKISAGVHGRGGWSRRQGAGGAPGLLAWQARAAPLEAMPQAKGGCQGATVAAVSPLCEGGRGRRHQRARRYVLSGRTCAGRGRRCAGARCGEPCRRRASRMHACSGAALGPRPAGRGMSGPGARLGRRAMAFPVV